MHFVCFGSQLRREREKIGIIIKDGWRLSPLWRQIQAGWISLSTLRCSTVYVCVWINVNKRGHRICITHVIGRGKVGLPSSITHCIILKQHTKMRRGSDFNWPLDLPTRLAPSAHRQPISNVNDVCISTGQTMMLRVIHETGSIGY